MELKLKLAETFVVDARRGEVALEVDLAKLPESIVAQLFGYGLKQKIADAASSAAKNAAIAVAGNRREGESPKAYEKRVADAAAQVTQAEVNAEAARMMEACRDRLYAGDWGVERGGGSGMDAGLVNFVMDFAGDINGTPVDMAKIFEARVKGWKDAKKPERRELVDAWLDEKEGRRDDWKARQRAAQEAAARAVAEVSLDDL